MVNISSKNYTERFGKLKNGLREDEIEEKIIHWLEDSVTFAELENYKSTVETEKVISGDYGIKARNFGENFIGIVDVTLTVQYSELGHGIAIEYEKQSSEKESFDVLKHGLGYGVAIECKGLKGKDNNIDVMKHVLVNSNLRSIDI